MLREKAEQLLDPEPFNLWLERSATPAPAPEVAGPAGEPEISRGQSEQSFVAKLIKAAIINYHPG